MCEFQILHLSRLTCTFFPELRSLLHFDFIASETNRVNTERDISVLLKCLNRDSRTEAFYWANTKVCIPSTQLKYLLFVFVYVRLCTYTLYHTILCCTVPYVTKVAVNLTEIYFWLRCCRSIASYLNTNLHATAWNSVQQKSNPSLCLPLLLLNKQANHLNLAFDSEQHSRTHSNS